METHTVLVVGDPGRTDALRYVLDDDGDGVTEPDQRGRVTLREGRPPVFESDAAAQPSCALIFSSIAIVRDQMTTTSPSGGYLPGSRTWVRIS